MAGLAVSTRVTNRAVIVDLVADRVASRLAAADASLWGAAAQEEERWLSHAEDRLSGNLLADVVHFPSQGADPDLGLGRPVDQAVDP